MRDRDWVATVRCDVTIWLKRFFSRLRRIRGVALKNPLNKSTSLITPGPPQISALVQCCKTSWWIARRRRDFFVSARRRRKFFTILDDQMHSELTKSRGFSMDLNLKITKISPTGGLSAIPMIFHSPKSNPWQNNPWQSWYPKSNPWRHGCHGLSNPWRGNYGSMPLEPRKWGVRS